MAGTSKRKPELTHTPHTLDSVVKTGDASAPSKAEQQDRPAKCDLDNSSTLRHVLDDAVCETVVARGYPTDQSVSNVKLTLGFMACGCAAMAYLLPGKFPENRFGSGVFVVLYMICSAFAMVFEYFFEQNAIMFSKGHVDGKGSSLVVISKMPRFSETYTLTLQDTLPGNGRTPAGVVSCELYIGKLFHADRYLAAASLKKEVETLMDRFEAADLKRQKVR